MLRVENGKITEERIEETSLEEAARRAAEKALKDWNPADSDFTALRSKYEIHYTLPVKPELVDVIRDAGLQIAKEGNELIVEVPMVVISFDNEWLGDVYKDNKMYIVATYLDEEELNQIREYAVEATTRPKQAQAEEEIPISEEEFKRLEEDLEELEEEEKPKKSRRKRKKKSSKQ